MNSSSVTPPTTNIIISDDDDGGLNSDEETLNNNNNGNNKIASNELANNLFKWTNYIHGWQERFIVLKNGILSYYKNQLDTQYGCRGAITLKQSSIIPHDLDDCRFDIRVNDCVWYLRAQSNEERQKWINVLEEHRSESGYGSQTSLKRHGSMLSLNSVASLSLASTGSFKRGRGLKEKLAEMDTFKDILCKQVETLQTYFDACANSMTKGFEPYHKEFEKDIDENNSGDEDNLTITKDTGNLKHRIQDHAAMSLDFKGEAVTFKATTAGILSNLSHCIELMHQRDESWKRKLEKEIEKKKKINEAYTNLLKEKANITVINGPDFEEGPHSQIKEEQFFDAIDNTLDNLELEEERRIASKNNIVQIPEVVKEESVSKHRLSDSIEKIVQNHLSVDRQEMTDVWELFASDGEMKLYRREVEENGIVLDPLKAVHTVKGVTGHEMCHYFWNPQVRMDWETTLDSTQVIEALDENTLVFHQIHKRVWPSAQRDACFWSHMRSISNDDDDEQPDWIVVNYSIDHQSAPVKEPMIRAIADIALTCETVIINPPADKKDISRKHLQCKITYVAQINPGGWAPASVLRTIYKREYPKFLKRFTQYVIDQTAKKPIMF